MRFIRTKTTLVAVDHIVSADYSNIEALQMSIVDLNGDKHTLVGIHALEAAMTLNPGCVEGKRLKWARHVWAVHNLIGHPVMQVLAWMRCYKLAMRVHDGTVPKPKMEGP